MQEIDGFLREDPRPRQCQIMVSDGLSYLSQKAIVKFKFFAFFCNQVDIKSVVNCWKDFLGVLQLHNYFRPTYFLKGSMSFITMPFFAGQF